jgi:rhodanese-related sulfurtransferase
MKKDISHITCEHLLGLRTGEKEHVVLDVRDRLEYESGHIKDSLNIPRKELATNIANLLPEKGHKVVVVVGPTDEGDITAVHATLTDLGYGDVEFLAGGFDRFCEIAPLEIEPELLEQTPEEAGFTDRDAGEDEIDPHQSQDEPLL